MAQLRAGTTVGGYTVLTKGNILEVLQTLNGHGLNSDTANRLQTPRNINGTAFDGSADIVTEKWGKSRTLSFTGAITGSAAIDGSGNVSITTSTSNLQGVGSNNSNGTFIAYPSDGRLNLSNDQTGYIKIRLPQSWTNTMMQFQVTVYNYMNNKSVTYILSGYNYTSEWINCSAYCLSHKDAGTYGNLPVRFGHDGTKCAIYIGNADTSWSYLKVNVQNIFLARQGTELSNWISGWEVTNTTSLGTISVTVTDTSVRNHTHSTLTRGSYLTGSNYNGTSATTWAVDATSANTGGKVVARNSNGDFAARYITMSRAVTTRIDSSSELEVMNGSSAQKILSGGILISSMYADRTKIPANGLFATGNIITRGNVGVGYTHSDTAAPLITLALGDPDTGFKWISDGIFDIYSDSQQVARIKKASEGIVLFKPLETGAQIKSTLTSGTAPFVVASNTVVTNLNADLLDGLHATSFWRTDTSNSHNIRFASGDGRGIRFWDSDSYTIYMSTSTNSTSGGRVAGDTTSDYNMYFKMSAGTNRGFVFKYGNDNIAGITSTGDIKAKGSISGGDNKFELKYNSSNESLDFIFN